MNSYFIDILYYIHNKIKAYYIKYPDTQC